MIVQWWSDADLNNDCCTPNSLTTAGSVSDPGLQCHDYETQSWPMGSIRQLGALGRAYKLRFGLKPEFHTQSSDRQNHLLSKISKYCLHSQAKVDLLYPWAAPLAHDIWISESAAVGVAASRNHIRDGMVSVRWHTTPKFTASGRKIVTVDR